jgi:hypothetical protein
MTVEFERSFFIYKMDKVEVGDLMYWDARVKRARPVKRRKWPSTGAASAGLMGIVIAIHEPREGSRKTSALIASKGLATV